MSEIQLAFIVGARPNFMKVAPILRALESRANVAKHLIHTGQHYDASLSDVFFEELQIRRPDVSLNVGSGTHGVQTAKLIERVESLLMDHERLPAIDRLVVLGDVNSTMAAALAAVKLDIPVAHVEAGLRSFDRRMPEEINRVVTDAISDLLLVSDPAGIDNLRREGADMDNVHLVGNVMIDTLFQQRDRARKIDTSTRFGVTPCEYGVITLHRPSNVDDPEVFRELLQVLGDISSNLPFIFPVHPRTRARIDAEGWESWLESFPRLQFVEPLGYLDLLSLNLNARVIVTDSGGLQEESTALGIPCLTMRENTERPITVSEGTSTLIGNDADLLREQLSAVLNGTYKQGRCPELWDGHASERIADALIDHTKPRTA